MALKVRRFDIRQDSMGTWEQASPNGSCVRFSDLEELVAQAYRIGFHDGDQGTYDPQAVISIEEA